VSALSVQTATDQNVLADVQENSGLAKADLASVIGSLLNGLLGFLGTVFLVLIIYAGFLWMTAAGNDEKINKAQKIIRASVIGLLVVMLSFVITHFVFTTLIDATAEEITLEQPKQN
jgi:amino acid transporter